MEQPEKLNLASLDIKQQQLEKLKELFPEVFIEANKIDWDKLKLTLGEQIDVGKERFGMNWPGKADCFKTIQQPSIATLVPAREESVDFDTTQNLFIEGDNLEVLKLLQKSYLGKIKMIYIDPPYNTGNDFIYPDNYSENLQTYLEYTGQADSEGRKFSTNAETDGRFHSKWMNMMYPRLFLSKNLLTDDGIIFISIGEDEINNLQSLCREIFGEENYVATVIWQKVFSPKNSASFFSEDHEYILVVAKNKSTWRPELLLRSDEAISRYTNPDQDKRGVWMSGAMQARNYYSKGSYEVTSPSGKKFHNPKGTYWRFSKDRFDELDQDNRIWWGETRDNVPRLKRFLSEVKQGITPQTLWLYKDVGHTQEAKEELLKYVSFQEGENVLNSLKPSRLIQRALQVGTKSDTGDIVLDFFSGSGTTAHSVIKQNALDKGNRKFILVQLPEKLIKEEPHLKSIADLGKSRIRNVVSELKNSIEREIDFNGGQVDTGFRVLKLQPSNFSIWNSGMQKEPEEILKQLELNINHISATATQEAILFELLLKSGFALTTPIVKETLSRKIIYSVAEGELLVCLEKELTQDLIKAIAEKKPSRVICLDEGFQNNDQLKTNAVQIMKSKGVTKFQTV